MPGFSTIQSAVDSLARGEVIIVVDAEDRENEGDFICAAEKATTETVNFVLSGRGQFCTPLLPDVARRLQLVPVVETNTTPTGTGFLTPIDHRTGRTGITAEERCRTVRAIADPATVASDFVRPATCILSWRKRAAFSAAQATPKRPSICAAWLASHRLA